MIRNSVIFVAAITVVAAMSCSERTAADTAERRIDSLLRDVPARVGVYAQCEGMTIACRADEPFPMLSTFKVPVAIAAMQRMEREGTPLSQRIDIAAAQLLPDTYSPMRERHPDGWKGATLDSLFAYAVSLSDNNACDILIGYAGGIDSVALTASDADIGPMTINATEEDMHRAPEIQRANVCTPRSAVRLLERLGAAELLSEAYTAALIGHMAATSTGADKLRAGVPQNAVLAHKTGSSDRTPEGVKIADNDMGIVTLPDGRRYAIAVFVSDSHLDDKDNAAIIAAVSRIVYEAFAGQHKK